MTTALTHITTQVELRRAFFRETGIKRRYKSDGKLFKQNDYPASVRTEWCVFIDGAARGGIISDALAQRATL